MLRAATAITLRDDRSSGKPGAARKLMFHELLSWLLAKLPRSGVNARAMALLKNTAEKYSGRDRLPTAGRDRITGMLRGLDWDAARSYALADWTRKWLLLPVFILAIMAVLYTAPTWGADLAGLTKPSGTLGLYGLMVLSVVATWHLTRSTSPRADIAIGGALAATIAAYFAVAQRELRSPIALAVVIAVIVPAFFVQVNWILWGAAVWGMDAWIGRDARSSGIRSRR